MVRLEEQHIPISNVTDLSKGKFKNEVRIKFCDALIQHLERFPDLPLIKDFQLFDPQQLPYSQEELGTYGDEFIAELCDHYPRIDQCTALQEWATLHSMLQAQEYKDKGATDLLKMLSANETF